MRPPSRRDERRGAHVLRRSRQLDLPCNHHPRMSPRRRALMRRASPARRTEGVHMYATVRRYEGIDKVRSEEITRKVTDSLLPSISKLPGFSGYFLIDAGEGVLTSVGRFDRAAKAHPAL